MILGNRPHPSRRSADGFTAIELLVVLAILSVVAAMAVPFTKNTFAVYRLSGDAQSLTNAVAIAKIRAASDFSRARVYVDLAGKSAHIETWQKTGTPAWVSEGNNISLSPNDTFSWGSVAVAPPNTQTVIGQAGNCQTAAGAAISGTACVIFNSRGIPIDTTGSPTGAYALYVTDGSAVFGVTISASGQVRLWRTAPTVTPQWIQQ